MNTTPSSIFFHGAPASRVLKKSLATALLMLAIAGGAQAASLVANGDFETATKDPAWPDGWARPKIGECSWQAEGAGHFVRVKATAPGQTILLYRLLKIPAEVKAVEISVRGRLAEFKAGPQPWFDARLMADFKNDAGAKIKGAKAITFRKNTEGWVERKVAFLVPAGATALEIMPALFQADAGTFDFDDLSVTPVDPASLPTAAAK